MSEQAEKPREFLPLTTEEIYQFLEEGARTFASAIIWTKDQEQVVNTQFTAIEVKNQTFLTWIPKGFDSAKFEEILGRQGSRDCYFSVSLSRANMFFHCQYIGIENNALKFHTPGKAFKVQRRKDLRFMIPDGYVLKVEFQDPLFPENRIEKKAWDLSAGGCGFIVPHEEEVLYQPGLLLKNFTFTIRGKRISTDAEVRHAKPLKEGTRPECSKVGVIFKSLRAMESQAIASYVFEESRKFFTRFI
ncbi:MAG: PilZ domain-containing protein [Oligoflexia bacterium]|nr:PilZ domain-containing protein [Oligoflexia bacterium]